jgi:arabinose-5-phosphate isomerase
MGKSGIVAQRMAAALASLSIPSTFVHASEWAHGELGSMRSGDAVVLFSNSGESAECVDTAVEAQRRGLAVLAITGRSSSSLGALANAEIVLEGGAGERELLGKVPSRSIVLAESAINGVLSAIAQKRGFGAADFKANHPGGAIGRAS